MQLTSTADMLMNRQRSYPMHNFSSSRLPQWVMTLAGAPVHIPTSRHHWGNLLPLKQTLHFRVQSTRTATLAILSEHFRPHLVTAMAPAPASTMWTVLRCTCCIHTSLMLGDSPLGLGFGNFGPLTSTTSGSLSMSSSVLERPDSAPDESDSSSELEMASTRSLSEGVLRMSSSSCFTSKGASLLKLGSTKGWWASFSAGVDGAATDAWNAGVGGNTGAAPGSGASGKNFDLGASGLNSDLRMRLNILSMALTGAKESSRAYTLSLSFTDDEWRPSTLLYSLGISHFDPQLRIVDLRLCLLSNGSSGHSR